MSIVDFIAVASFGLTCFGLGYTFDKNNNKPVAPTRETGGSQDGYKPLMLGQRLKALAFALLQPHCS